MPRSMRFSQAPNPELNDIVVKNLEVEQKELKESQQVNADKQSDDENDDDK